jgi:hypothetical protein
VPAALLQPRLERGTALTLCVLGVTYLGVLLPLLFVLGIVDLEVVPARIRRLWRLLDRRVPVQPDPTETA